ncbi:MAG: hypothetical protein C3F15_14645 [Holophagae bacterium]|nr:MAG: hypothetical protein C3F15_14645 [Holophagae bacterium]
MHRLLGVRGRPAGPGGRAGPLPAAGRLAGPAGPAAQLVRTGAVAVPPARRRSHPPAVAGRGGQRPGGSGLRAPRGLAALPRRLGLPRAPGGGAVRRLLVTFDVEEVDWGRPAAGSGWEPCRPSAEGLAAILPMLARLGLHTTLFCTSSFARAHPDLLRDAADRGHEIASHGLDHRDDYGAMAPAAAAGRLRDSRLELEHLTGSVVRGLRTPRLALFAATAVGEAGFSYDASPHPTWIRHGLRGLRTPRVPWPEAGIVRVPLSATPGLRLPAGWYVLRTLGAAPAALLARRAGAGAPWVHLYFHPWEAVELRRWLGAHPLGWGTGPAWVASLERLLEILASRFPPTTVSAAVDAWRMGRTGSI